MGRISNKYKVFSELYCLYDPNDDSVDIDYPDGCETGIVLNGREHAIKELRKIADWLESDEVA